MTRVRSLDQWPRERRRTHERSRFDASWSSTMRLLDRELDKLGARNVSILLDITPDQIRQDGTAPLASARLDYPGVVVAFDSRDHGPLKYVADKFSTWQDNVRAIALGLEALRKVDRYGITSKGEQYTGWAALPPPSSAMDKQTAAHVLRNWAQTDPGDWPTAVTYKQARARAHPDRNAGDQTGWDAVEEAARVLGLDPK